MMLRTVDRVFKMLYAGFVKLADDSTVDTIEGTIEHRLHLLLYMDIINVLFLVYFVHLYRGKSDRLPEL